LVWRSEKIFCSADASVAVGETNAFALKKIISAGAATLFIKKMIFFRASTIFFADQKIFSGIGKMVSIAEKIFSITIIIVEGFQ
jgi:hypothetical protein